MMQAILQELRERGIGSPDSPLLSAELPREAPEAPKEAGTVANNLINTLRRYRDAVDKQRSDTNSGGPTYALLKEFSKVLYQVGRHFDSRGAFDQISASHIEQLQSVALTMKIVIGQDPNTPLAKLDAINDELIRSLLAFRELKNSQLPATVTIDITIRGSRAKTAELHEQVKSIALESLRREQSAAAEEFEWDESRDENGVLLEYLPPEDNCLEPVEAVQDPDSPEVLRRNLETVFGIMRERALFEQAIPRLRAGSRRDLPPEAPES